jgi:alpha-tubulin suppressor-like RCC1 family protein
MSFGCASSANVNPTTDGGRNAGGSSSQAGGPAAGGRASGNTGTGGVDAHAGVSGQANGGGSGASDGTSGRGDGGESGDAGGNTGGSGGAAGANASGNGGSSAAAGSGTVAGSGGASGSGSCGSGPCTASTVTELRAGGATVCALFYSGKIKCWGHNLYGQLGYGNTKNVGDDEPPSAVGYVSLSKSSGLVVEQLSVGHTHACALLSDGTVTCWGRGGFGALGYGNADELGDDELPSDAGSFNVTTTPGVSVTQISAGGNHTCVLLSDSTIKCWGDNAYHQLGYDEDEDIGDDELPSDMPAVSVSTTPGITVTEISAGYSHTCALLSDGSVKCWGANNYGQLARGTPANVADDKLPSEVEPIVLTTTPGVTATAIRAASRSTCVLLSNGSVKCWGDAPAELVGTGEVGPVLDPSSVGPIAVTDNPDLIVTDLVNAMSHTCARLSDGSAVCWGASAYGALGYGNTDTIGDDETPVSAGAVSITTNPGVTVAQLVGGSDLTCALLSDNSVKCWGSNTSGQLGNGKIDGYAVGDDELPSSVEAVKLF